MHVTKKALMYNFLLRKYQFNAQHREQQQQQYLYSFETCFKFEIDFFQNF